MQKQPEKERGLEWFCEKHAMLTVFNGEGAPNMQEKGIDKCGQTK